LFFQILARNGFVAACVFGATLLPASAADVSNGKRIAERWCAACHVVAPEQTRASADAPTFGAIAAKYATSGELGNFLTDPHPPMPDMALSQPEIADLVAYIRSLGTP
jgi:mono/diheme cytochrome c family protein